MYNGKNPILNVKRKWNESLDLPGAGQMRHLRALIESRPFLTRIPDQSVLLNTANEMLALDTLGNRHVQATRDGTLGKNDATYLMVYTPIGRSLKLNTKVIAGKMIRAWWYDPRNGAAIPLGTVENKGSYEPGWNSLPWHNGAGPDWVLVIDDAAKGYPPPGQFR
jgi:hypothetical protein